MKKFLMILSASLVITAMLAAPAYAMGGRFARTAAAGRGLAVSTPVTAADVESILEARKAALDKLVSDGKITQAQADEYLDYCRTRLEDCVANGGVCSGGMGGGYGAGCGLGGGYGAGCGLVAQ